MPVSYTHLGPPFNFLGTMTESQRVAFETWVQAREDELKSVQEFRQMRSYQLRKAAGVLERHHATVDPRGLKPSFRKEAWEPIPDGHIPVGIKDDHLPANTMADIKSRFTPALARDDEAVFRMNYVRTRIEAEEDAAQVASEAKTRTEADLKTLRGYFSDPCYQMCLVRDKTDLYRGVPRFRTHPLDPPTPWEQLMVSQVIPDASV